MDILGNRESARLNEAEGCESRRSSGRCEGSFGDSADGWDGADIGFGCEDVTFNPGLLGVGRLGVK